MDNSMLSNQQRKIIKDYSDAQIQQANANDRIYSLNSANFQRSLKSNSPILNYRKLKKKSFASQQSKKDFI